jgi:ubiquinone/menaquinone biosynthesis C-methylase UbiE
LDRDILFAAQFSDVTISNLDTQHQGNLKPYQWSLQDAENLSFADDAFDFAIAHMGLHQCFSRIVESWRCSVSPGGVR